ncbi:matrixin family metalloprotease [Nitrosopumilus sp.]|uniref:matrixin family metalloprotease n=1 Tax=Nitrosopumilus sp. TaxID=2024843 RepID=UPI003D105DD2
MGFLMISLSGFIQNTDAVAPLTSKFLSLDNKGIITSAFWDVLPDEELDVVFLDSHLLTDDQLDAVVYAIKSHDSVELGSLLETDLENSKSIYYFGWEGALTAASNMDTSNTIPAKFNIVSSLTNEKNIVIQFSNHKESQGYSGYARVITHNDEILQSHIMIYDVESLSATDLTTIIRHEFGHALGLGHSIDSDDLMANMILTEIPYISECHIDAIRDLYDDDEDNFTECK